MTGRLGLLGGTFDPVHVGHLVVAVAARSALDLDRVLLVVANQPWQKGDRRLTSAEDRLAMVEAAVEGHAGLEASRIEIDRGGDSYTADTLEQLAAEDPDRQLFLIVGSDVAAELDTWRRPDVVARLATIAVVNRKPTPPATPADPERRHGQARSDLGIHPRWRVEWVDIPPLDISSSDLRERQRRGLPLDLLVPDPVINLIHRRGLYDYGT